MTLDKLLSKARALEASESQASGMEHSSQPSTTTENVHRIHQK